MSIQIHHTTGRLRLKLAQIRKNPARASEIRERALRCAGVRSAVANCITGSLLIHYDPARADANEIMRALAQAGRLPPAAVVRNGACGMHPIAGKLLDAVAEKLIERSALALLGALL